MTSTFKQRFSSSHVYFLFLLVLLCSKTIESFSLSNTRTFSTIRQPNFAHQHHGASCLKKSSASLFPQQSRGRRILYGYSTFSGWSNSNNNNSTISSSGSSPSNPSGTIKNNIISLTKSLLSNIQALFTNYLNGSEKVIARLAVIGAAILQNVKEETLRLNAGEGLLFVKATIVAIIFFGVHPLLQFFVRMSGNFMTLLGIYLISVGVWELGENTSIRLAPLSHSKLVTSGIYSVVRHPMYSGLLALCIGISITGNSVDKMIFSFILSLVIDKIAENEEALLIQKHGRNYADYAATTKRFIPQVY